MAAWRWASRRDRTLWLGIFVLVLGLGLLVERFVPGLSFTGLVLLALGVVATLVWLAWRWRWAMVPAVLLLALAAAELAVGVGILVGDGWTSLALGGGFLLVWAVGSRRGRHAWAIWPGLLFLLIGLAQRAQGVGRTPGLDVVWPIAVIVIGILLLVNAVRERGGWRSRDVPTSSKPAGDRPGPR